MRWRETVWVWGYSPGRLSFAGGPKWDVAGKFQLFISKLSPNCSYFLKDGRFSRGFAFCFGNSTFILKFQILILTFFSIFFCSLTPIAVSTSSSNFFLHNFEFYLQITTAFKLWRFCVGLRYLKYLHKNLYFSVFSWIFSIPKFELVGTSQHFISNLRVVYQKLLTSLKLRSVTLVDSNYGLGDGETFPCIFFII